MHRFSFAWPRHGLLAAGRRTIALVAAASLAACATGPDAATAGPPPFPDDMDGPVVECDVIVAGGSLAAFASALHAAREGAVTCLVEPTVRVGGQMTAEGVSAPDFAGHMVDSLNVGFLSRHSANQAPELAAWLRRLGSPGRCWVSSWCLPTASILGLFEDAARAEARLRIFRQAVVARVETRPSEARAGMREIVSIDAVQRGGSDESSFLSDVVAEWYDPSPSLHYPEKRTLTFVGREGRMPVVVEASAFGDVLVLSGARWLQGADATDGGTALENDTCGLAIVFPFALEYRATPVGEGDAGFVAAPAANDPRFSLGTFGWERVWTYRRLQSTDAAPQPGDLSMQNWNPGNDYRGGYYLQGVADTRREAAAGWRGGLRVDVIREAERQALDYAAWYREQAPASVRPFLALSRTWGHTTGLAPMPYLRDTRRSVGLDDYVLPGRAFAGPGSQFTGTVFPDRVAIGAYQYDFRPLRGCRMSTYGVSSYAALPYYIPFRALTSGDVANMLVAGKSMAQSTLANTATRLHPTEWHTGIAAGVAAAWMSAREVDSRAALERVAEVQARIGRWAPLEWTMVTPR